ALFGAVDVDAQQGGEQVADVLSGVQTVGDAAAVAGAEVQVAIRPEANAAAVVAARRPGQQDGLRFRVGARRVRAGAVEARRPAAVRLLLVGVDDVGDVEVAVLLELRVHDHAVDGPLQVDQQFLAGVAGVRGEGIDLAAPLGHDPAVTAGYERQLERL